MAIKTLQVANRTLIASIVAIVVGVVAIGVAIFDAWNGRRQLDLILEEKRRAPMLKVTATSRYVQKVSPARQGEPDNAYAVDLSLWLTNDERATQTANNIIVHVGFPDRMVTAGEWEKRGNSPTFQDAVAYDSLKNDSGDLNLVKNSDIVKAKPDRSGYREARCRGASFTAVVGEKKRISSHLKLVIADNSRPIRWYVQCREGSFPKAGYGYIELRELLNPRSIDTYRR